jgi:hypothetical protein
VEELKEAPGAVIGVATRKMAEEQKAVHVAVLQVAVHKAAEEPAVREAIDNSNSM